MGQYYKIANLTKREFIHPHKLASGLKAWEILANEMCTKAMFLLMVCGERRGGGDLQPHEAAGRWHGDHVVVVGDYADAGDFQTHNPSFGPQDIYGLCNEDAGEWAFTDVSDMVCDALEKELHGKFTGDGWRGWVSDSEAA